MVKALKHKMGIKAFAAVLVTAIAGVAVANDDRERVFRIGWFGPAAESSGLATGLVADLVEKRLVESAPRRWNGEDPYAVLGVAGLLGDNPASGRLARALCALNRNVCRIERAASTSCRFGACWGDNRGLFSWLPLRPADRACANADSAFAADIGLAAPVAGAAVLCGPLLDIFIDENDARYAPPQTDIVEAAFALGGCRRGADPAVARDDCMAKIATLNDLPHAEAARLAAEREALAIPAHRVTVRFVAAEVAQTTGLLSERAALMPAGSIASPRARFEFYPPAGTIPNAQGPLGGQLSGAAAVEEKDHPGMKACGTAMGAPARPECRFLNYDALKRMDFPFEDFAVPIKNYAKYLNKRTTAWVFDSFPPTPVLKAHCAFDKSDTRPVFASTTATQKDCRMRKFFSSDDESVKEHHGYAMSGVLAGYVDIPSGASGSLFVGAAPQAALGFVNRDNHETLESLWALKNYSELNPPDVFNDSNTLQAGARTSDLICELFSKKGFSTTLLVASAGNHGKTLDDKCDSFPACEASFASHAGACSAPSFLPNEIPGRIIAVASVDPSGDRRLPKSNYGRSIDVAAIGVAYSAAKPNEEGQQLRQKFIHTMGTSPAAAYVSGLALLLSSRIASAAPELGSCDGAAPIYHENKGYWLRTRILATADYLKPDGSPILAPVNGVPVSQFGLVNFKRALAIETDIIKQKTGPESNGVVKFRNTRLLKIVRDNQTRNDTVKRKNESPNEAPQWLDDLRSNFKGELEEGASEVFARVRFDQVQRLQQAPSGRWRVVYIEPTSGELIHIVDAKSVVLENAEAIAQRLSVKVTGGTEKTIALADITDYTARPYSYPCDLLPE